MTYVPPQECNFRAPPVKQPVPKPSKKLETAYQTLPSIYDSKVTADVYNCTLKTPITLTCHELLSLLSEVWTQIREATTARQTMKD